MQSAALPGTARIGVVGLGYVGLPLAVEFGKHYETMGFDIVFGWADRDRSGARFLELLERYRAPATAESRSPSVAT